MVVLITMIQLQPELVLPGNRNLTNFSETLKGWLNAPDYNSQYNHCLTESPYQTPDSARFQEHLSLVIAIYPYKTQQALAAGCCPPLSGAVQQVLFCILINSFTLHLLTLTKTLIPDKGKSSFGLLTRAVEALIFPKYKSPLLKVPNT